MNIDECIFFSLNSTARKASKFWKQSVSELGVTGVQGLVLHALLEEDQITSVQLGKRVQLDSATMTGVLDRLEQSDLIRRMADIQDRRAVQITLTAAGKEVTEKLQHRLVEANQNYTRNLNDQELKTLKDLLAKL
ncbi:MarR family winged helix-turn-helix transcriptional regulator [Neptunomonas japonica]|uniref:MarR family winged helix-turn-helix transcriptional regulator n=1 Tax=Neptunomonas japonica TaxID=417574 RepID=UPI00048D8C45|nr:MarR family transcriptional regulator [Neptunomonas japonica]